MKFRIDAPRRAVYQALLDARAVAHWQVPDGMTSQIHEFEGHEGGRFRISLTYDSPTETGKTSAHTDTFHGRFVKLVPNELVVQQVEFETADPRMQGAMTISLTLFEAAGATEVHAVHDQLPPGVAPADNELGWRMSLQKLSDWVVRRPAADGGAGT